MKIPELLAPAGTDEKLKAAIHYGADAVYLGGKKYSLRAHATNFSDEELYAAIAYAHEHGVKAYVTVNIFAHNRDLAGLPGYLRLLREAGADALIISDPGLLALARKTVPEMALHLSTQANVTNLASACFWASQGVKRLNLARELSLAEIREIRQASSAAIEIFTHGALCISYSGRCLLSLYLTGRDANQGNCAHPCRYRYQLAEEKRPGQFFPVEEDSRGTYIFNAKDLCLLNRLPDLIGTGIDSLKIEGRMKSVYYVGAIVRLYRAALDYWQENGLPAPGEAKTLPAGFSEELAKIGSRGYTENFFDTPPEQRDMLYEGAAVNHDYAPVGIIRQEGPRPLVEMRNALNAGEAVEYLGLGLANLPARVIAIHDEAGIERARANPNSLVRLTVVPPAQEWHVHGLIRKQRTREK